MVIVNLTFEYLIQQLYDGKIHTNLSEYKRKSWVKYCYHYSDVQNIASILNSGTMYSRNRSNQLNLMENDNASIEVIDQTDDWIKDYIRFYFRPKTPTQFNNEGFRSKLTMSKFHAHCPMPIFLLFNLNSILNLNNCYFSENSLANNIEHNLMRTPKEFQELPFSKIYHDTYLTNDIRNEIVSCRQAEIIVPHELPIDGLLEKILVRSPAEKVTLLTMLNHESLQKYSNLIQIDSKKTVFYARWEYLEEVILTEDRIRIINNNTDCNSQFKIDVILDDKQHNYQQTYSDSSWEANGHFNLGIGVPTNDYIIKIYLDENLAYRDKFDTSRRYNQPF